MSWLKEVFATEKPIIAMCHFDALPGDPSYDPGKGLARVLENAHKNLRALQDGAVDAVMFSNEASLP
jgi:predicted TIM-barrel enzyme